MVMGGRMAGGDREVELVGKEEGGIVGGGTWNLV
jgi:hypothetical protein